jgi:hypothetical protein
MTLEAAAYGLELDGRDADSLRLLSETERKLRPLPPSPATDAIASRVVLFREALGQETAAQLLGGWRAETVGALQLGEYETSSSVRSSRSPY